MSSSTPDERYVNWFRVLLVLAAAAVIGIGLVPRPPEHYDSFLARVLLGGVAVLGVVGSWVWSPLRAHLRLWTMATGYVLLGWFLYMSAVNGMGADNVLGLVPLVVLVSALARSVPAILSFGAYLAFGLVLVYATLEAPVIPLPIVLILDGVIVVGLGGMSLSRAQLEAALAESNASLEERVRERTRELAASNERLREEVQIRIQAESRAQDASRAKSAFLANMSHELRTPLTAILGYTELLREEDDPASAEEDLEKIHGSASHLLSIIQDVLDLARIESDQLKLEVAPLGLDDVVQAALALTTPQLEANRNEVVWEGAPDVRVLGDEIRLRQVFVNLLSNAAKFTVDGEVGIVWERRGDRVAVQVWDTGVGMSPQTAARVFERFAQGDESPTRVHGGTGLGLAISHELVHAMEGTLTVGVGATFTVELPAM